MHISHTFFSTTLLLAFSLTSALAQITSPLDKTVVNDSSAGKQLIGKHKFQLHWISWDKWKEFGDLTVIDRQGSFLIKGRQTKGADYLEIEGAVLKVEAKEFTFRGKIVTRVSYKNGGQPCEREGEKVFKMTGRRKYWRLQQMQSPCDETTDYVDIFLR